MVRLLSRRDVEFREQEVARGHERRDLGGYLDLGPTPLRASAELRF